VGITAEEKTIVRESLERASVRILARRFGQSKTTIMKTVHRVTRSVPDSRDVAAALHPVWSGILAVDGKYVRTKILRGKRFDKKERTRSFMCWLSGIDIGTGDLPHYALADEETMIDLVMYFRRLKEIGYELRVLISDGNPDIPRAARKIYGDGILTQLCTRHFIEGLKRKSLEAGLRDDAQTQNIILAIQRIIEAETIEEAAERFDELKAKRLRHPLHRLLVNDFRAHAEELTAHLRYPELRIPHTTNDAESIFHQLGLRIESLGQFAHWQHAESYLKAWSLWRRFTPFTDCKGPRKNRNKKAPLECAHCRIKGVDMFKIPRTNQP
jgi:hypothetical protein